MTTTTNPGFLNGWRIAGWGAAAALLLVPLLAMVLGAGVDWSGGDFLFVGVLLVFLGMTVELALRFRRGTGRRAGFVLFGLASFLTVWVNAAVGIVGDEASPVNAYYFLGVLGALALSALFRFAARPMALMAAVLAGGQFALALVATSSMTVRPVEWAGVAIFALLWSASALFLRRAAQAG